MNGSTIESTLRAAAPPISRRLHGRLIPRATIDTALEGAMFALLESHFIGVDCEVFQADLAEKSLVIVLEDNDGILRGFTTLCVYRTMAPGRRVTVVYSGDTIVDREHWGSHALARTWIHSVRDIASAADEDVYWLLLTSGYRTYRFLPVFFRTFHPRLDGDTASSERKLLDDLARERFGARYDSETGIVQFARPQILAGDLLLPGRTDDPHVRYFLARNPGYVSGDELVCLTRIDDGNLTPAGRRMAGLPPG
jgi:hypothetical protein